MSKKYHIETTEEYLARGGKITKLPKSSEVTKVDAHRSSNKGPVTILSYDEAELYSVSPNKENVERPKKPKKAKSAIPRIDLNALPENIRKRILAKFKENQVDGNCEEEA